MAELRQQAAAYVGRLRRSYAFTRAVAWLAIVSAHPLARAARNALLHAFALLIGESFEDELAAFSKKRLTVNDSYRDRLLAPEIADLVDLSEALQLTISQRKAFFRCFLHLDYMRRAGVSRAELLRYCGLRDTPAMRRLLPSDGAFAVDASPHRAEAFRTQRWDVLQLLAIMFSLCTMEPAALVEWCVETIRETARLREESGDDEDGVAGGEDEEGEGRRTSRIPDVHGLAHEVEVCLEFCYGVPSPVERRLGELLGRLCHRLSCGTVSTAEGTASLASLTGLFPVLLFPCAWAQRVIKRRVLGDATWKKLLTRRAVLRDAGLGGAFVAPAEIVGAANVHLHRKRQQRRGRGGMQHPVGSPASAASHGEQDGTSQPQRSTPRKVLPSEEHGGQRDLLAPAAAPPRQAFSARVFAGFAEYANADDAWRVTADSVLAAVLVWLQEPVDASSTNRTAGDAMVLFTETREKIAAKTLPPREVERLQRLLITEYGYQFTTFLLAKSSVQETGGDLVSTVSVRKEERRARQRYTKADAGVALVEDKAIYWKEYTDPLLKRVFYHNVRTGESRWEMPATLLKKRRKKGRRPSPARSPSSKRELL